VTCYTWSGKVPDCKQAEEQGCHRDADGGDNVKRGHADAVALIEQSCIQRERGEGGETAEYAGNQEQSPRLPRVEPVSKPAGKQPYRERTRDIDGERSEWKPEPEQPGCGHVDAVTQRAAETGAKEDD